MAKRILSALIGAPLLLFFTWLGGWYLALLVTGLALLSLREFLEIGRKAGFIFRSAFISVFCFAWLVFFLTGFEHWLLPLGLIWFILIFGRYALSYPDISLNEATYGLLAFIYSVVLFTYLYFLRELPHGLSWCFYVFIVVWASDSGAFFIGSAFGKRKLAPRVSPNKSVEGAVGGLVMAMVIGFVFWLITKEGNLSVILVLSIITSFVSQIGDLFESALKRSAGVKDSGNLIPGHGGILDRFDSFLFALPVVYFAIVLGLVGY
jgi:phosphatidate cytidylyltransferase